MDAVVEIVTERPLLLVLALAALVGLFFVGKLAIFRLLSGVLEDPGA